MNHLHELLTAPPASVAAPVLTACRTKAICFDAGTDDNLDRIRVIPELVRLPFPVCWFEYRSHLTDGTAVVVGHLLVEMSDKPRPLPVFHWLFARVGGGRPEWALMAYGALARDLSQGRDAWRCDGFTERGAESELRLISCFLSALHCANVRQREHLPAARLQRARARRGKVPLFSYWTLQLDCRSKRGEDLGGTHASPRVHLVRGHPRQYVPGAWTWVQPHARGNKAIGMVHKDYSAGPTLVAAAR